MRNLREDAAMATYDWGSKSPLLRPREMLHRRKKDYLDRIEAHSQLPPVYSAVGPSYPLWLACEALWGYCMHLAEVDGLKPTDPKASLRKFNVWYPTTREDFLQRARKLLQPIAGTQSYPKHFPRAGETDQQVAARSASLVDGGLVSLLAPDLTDERLVSLVWAASCAWIDALMVGLDKAVQWTDGVAWEVASDSAKVRRAVEVRGLTTGYVAGKATSLLAVEWSDQIIHAYPISSQDGLARNARVIPPSMDTSGSTQVDTGKS